MTTITGTQAATAAATPSKSGFASLGAGDFIKLMTAQMQMQDPFQPVDNKEMLAQMAQFSSLSAANDMGATLKSIAGKLDAVLAAQTAAAKASPATTTPTTTA
ncbi:MAG: flagellar biosynthesis protein FlgD [Sphingomonadales bacterium]|nr:flagellar biosynthesis protein FlgD [Sphingomonadales bacterium]